MGIELATGQVCTSSLSSLLPESKNQQSSMLMLLSQLPLSPLQSQGPLNWEFKELLTCLARTATGLPSPYPS